MAGGQEANSAFPDYFFSLFSSSCVFSLFCFDLIQLQGGEEFIDLDSSIASVASRAPALKLPVISFLCLNMCFLSGMWRQEEKQAHRQLWQAITPQLVWEAEGWALVCWQGRGFNTPEEKMAIGRTVVRKPRAQPWLLFYSNSLCWLNIAGVVGGDCLGKGKQISPQQDASIGSLTKLHIKLYFKRFCQ